MRPWSAERKAEVLQGLYMALKALRVPGTSFERTSDPVVYTENTCTRVREKCFFIKRTLPNGYVTETAFLGVEHKDIAASLVREMTAPVIFS
ncbi:hypothetical protein [Nocardiopsis algeriensis]|uniref:Uncharacterized protein n=1 Tax=Nocardiopsis algeriensis TaxID=1478215 RepID=A0A841IJY5_9ACTN|nr:hypothetical protein [Nocardiopsis algeriensis]MBB6118372.1 hypothetical protein [Nocardiopsis algeriensis]